MSEIKVNKISPRTACGTTTLGDTGDTFTIPAGVTITNNGTAAGFGATGAASWDTTVKTGDFTAVSGVGYFVNTTAGIITVTLPASPSAGDVVAVSDYAGTADTNNITIGRNGSNINGAAADLTVAQENSAVTLVYVDSTQGWKATDTSNLNDIVSQPSYIAAIGGTITECGNFKIHTFTGPGTFCVSTVGNPAGGPSDVDYLVVAGGGGGGAYGGGGAGAGGYRESPGAASGCYSVSPLGASPATAITITAQGYSIVVGAGGTGHPVANTNGGVSSGLGIESAGGGFGGTDDGNLGQNGGSAGGGGRRTNGGTGNTPPVSPAQGTNGGNGVGSHPGPGSGGGGGGAIVAGSTGGPVGGNGGNGATSSINGSAVARAGGGGGASGNPGGGSGGTGGGGSGGQQNNTGPGVSGTVNTGGGGGGASDDSSPVGQGGSGIVIIRYKFQN
jgi:hypothetical protein